MNRAARAIETVILTSRWLAVPFLLGLIIGLAALIYTFGVKLFAFLTVVRTSSEEEAIVGMLKLVDLSLASNLILIVIFSGYENFIAPIRHDTRARVPEGLVGIGFSGLKQKLLGSILAIAAVSVLEWFMDIDRAADTVKLGWVVGILIAFAAASVLLAVADKLSAPTQKSQP